MHYARWQRHGTTDGTHLNHDVSTLDRFLAFVDKQPNGCWLWTGTLNNMGYAVFKHDGHNYGHRWSYTHHVGPIPEGLSLDHLCRTPSCVCPTHLEPVPQRENVMRGQSPTAANAAKTHCKYGHEFTPDNLYTAPSIKGRRRCLTCARIKSLSRSSRDR